MTTPVYLPTDEFSGVGVRDMDLAADYLELKAILSREGQSYSEDIVDALELSAEAEFHDVNDEMENREEVATGAVARLTSRKRILSATYPFSLDATGARIDFTADKPDLGQTAYLVSLLLSNLRYVSPLLDGSYMHPSDDEVRQLRQFFQYFATAAIAAEIQGPAWSFGHPRPDGSGFIKKLTEIWSTLRDGAVQRQSSAPTSPKDDHVDVFGWRPQPDGLPGFLLVAAQVATGKNWKDKPIGTHISGVFQKRWFAPEPVTRMVAYHVIPFARPDGAFRDDVSVLGNVLHRLRVPRRVSEAADLVSSGVVIEAFDQLSDAVCWMNSYLARARQE